MDLILNNTENREFFYYTNFVATGDTPYCHKDDFRCHKRQKFASWQISIFHVDGLEGRQSVVSGGFASSKP